MPFGRGVSSLCRLTPVRRVCLQLARHLARGCRGVPGVLPLIPRTLALDPLTPRTPALWSLALGPLLTPLGPPGPRFPRSSWTPDSPDPCLRVFPARQARVALSNPVSAGSESLLTISGERLKGHRVMSPPTTLPFQMRECNSLATVCMTFGVVPSLSSCKRRQLRAEGGADVTLASCGRFGARFPLLWSLPCTATSARPRHYLKSHAICGELFAPSPPA